MNTLLNISVSPKQKTILIHVVFWIIYSLFNYIINLIQYLGNAYIEDAFAKFFIAAFIFYTNALIILPIYFKRKKYISFAVSLIVLAFLSFFLKELIYSKILTSFRFPPSPYTLIQSFVMNLWWWFQYTLFGIGYWFAKELIENEREKLKLEREKLKLEKEKIEAEYAYLKAQINPHFFINVLNFLYSQALQSSVKSLELLSSGILILADIMRYVTSTEEDEDGFIYLTKEVRQIKNLIDINQLRFDKNLNIDFTMEGDISKVKVLPFVFTTLVENAFKHGKLAENGDAIKIHLVFAKNKHLLTFYVRNRKNAERNRLSSGIGMKNIRRRLAYTYRENHKLDVNEDFENFEVHLSINI